MFKNFIYIIIALLIYTAYQPGDEVNFHFLTAFFLFVLLIIIFICVSYFQFKNLEKQISEKTQAFPEHKFQTILTRQSVMALFFYAMDIYGLNLSTFILKLSFFLKIPTIHTLIFIMLFLFYMAIVWWCGYRVSVKLNMTSLSRKSHVISNISFSIPVILPWLFLSGCADVINLMPFETLKRLLASTEGQSLYLFVLLCAVAIFSPFIIQKFWKCKPVEAGCLRNKIKALCKKAGIDFSDILYWRIFDGKMITAGVMGLIKRFRYLLITDALIQVLSPEEIEAVVTHEIGHVKKKHLLFYLMFFAGYIIVSFTAFDLVTYAAIYIKPLYNIIYKAGIKDITILSAATNLSVIAIFIIYFRYVFGYFMRNFERQADIYVYTLFNSGKQLISTFEKIAMLSNEPYDKPNWHHFSIKERIEYLKKCEKNRLWVDRHNRKIKKSIGIYLAGMFITGMIGYQVSFGEAGKILNKHFFEKILSEEIEKTPNNFELYRIKGDLHLNKNQFSESIMAYERSLELNQKQPEVLNNLAWILATCKDKKFIDTKRAVLLAELAVMLKPAPHILDTLAESYYSDGRYEDAVKTGEKALYASDKDKKYYEKQLKKFQTAAKKLR